MHNINLSSWIQNPVSSEVRVPPKPRSRLEYILFQLIKTILIQKLEFQD